jgi:hypothetical protein
MPGRRADGERLAVGYLGCRAAGKGCPRAVLIRANLHESFTRVNIGMNERGRPHFDGAGRRQTGRDALRARRCTPDTQNARTAAAVRAFV